MRVELRTPTAADQEEFVAAMRASRKLHRPWLAAPTTPEAFDSVLDRVADENSEPMLVCRRSDSAIVGFINISQIVRGLFQSGYLSYGAVAAYAGHGYMREGLELVLARAFGELRLHRLEANIQPGNAASIALVRGAGFVREGFSERYLKIGVGGATTSAGRSASSSGAPAAAFTARRSACPGPRPAGGGSSTSQ